TDRQRERGVLELREHLSTGECAEFTAVVARCLVSRFPRRDFAEARAAEYLLSNRLSAVEGRDAVGPCSKLRDGCDLHPGRFCPLEVIPVALVIVADLAVGNLDLARDERGNIERDVINRHRLVLVAPE